MLIAVVQKDIGSLQTAAENASAGDDEIDTRVAIEISGETASRSAESGKTNVYCRAKRAVAITQSVVGT